MAYKPLLSDSGTRDKARRYVDTSTGEIISRRQYDKRLGTLRGFGSYEKKAEVRKEYGIKGKNLGDLGIAGPRRYVHAKSQHFYVQSRSDRFGADVSALLEKRGNRQATVSVRMKDKNGQWRQSKAYKPTQKGIGGILASAAFALLAEYDLDVDYNDDGTVDAELLWSEGY